MSATFMINVYDFPRGKVSVKVDVMEFGLYDAKADANQLDSTVELSRVGVVGVNGPLR